MGLKKRISLPAASWVSEDGRCYVAVEDKGDYLTSANGGKPAKARRLLQEAVLDIIRADQARERHWGRRLIVTNEGSIFLVEYRRGWQYSITGKDRKNASSCFMGTVATLEETLAYARRHAETGFNGIAFEAPV